MLDAEGAIWFADASRGEVARVHEGGDITDVIATPDHAYACTLGGADGRQLFVLTCPTPPMPGIVAGSGRLWTVAVDVPHARPALTETARYPAFGRLRGLQVALERFALVGVFEVFLVHDSAPASAGEQYGTVVVDEAAIASPSP